MKHFFSACFILVSLAGCAQQSSKNEKSPNEISVGGSCEGCEAIFESPVPFESLTASDTLPGYGDPGPRIRISGTIFQPGGKTPAPGIVIYVYHTDQEGNYPKLGNEKGFARQHGYIRGWIKTNSKGEYEFYTLVPASYPNSRNPKHIHAIIKEPGKTAYWIDDFVFRNDPLLPEREKNRPAPAGGNGVLDTKISNGLQQATRDIILGLNIQGYPN